jgi:hypothetical protein
MLQLKFHINVTYFIYDIALGIFMIKNDLLSEFEI